MPNPDCIAIGLTGAFGSGCSTAASQLEHHRDFVKVRLSTPVRERFGEHDSPSRQELQRLGDEIRESEGADALARLALETVDEAAALLVIDGVRNVAEVAHFKNVFGHRFTLIGIVATPEARWSRIRNEQYLDPGMSEGDFHNDDRRDRNEETEYGQQVELCMDSSDILIDNTEGVTLNEFLQKVESYADLCTGAERRHATDNEVFMHMAYAGSHSSKCLKRHVGAVIVDERSDVVAVGWNENPTDTKPCMLEPAYEFRCYRDIVRDDALRELADEGYVCPVCSTELPVLEGPPWYCPSCADEGRKTDLAAVFFPDRAMSWCTAVHAEVRAILAADRSLRGSTLYSTTFPCFQCAEKIAHVGISQVIFTEVYPDVRAADRLDLAQIEYAQFEGVRSSAFERLFAGVKPD